MVGGIADQRRSDMSDSTQGVKNILLMGRPGVGKTLSVKTVAAEFRNIAGGFTTGEIRERGIRKGFSVTTLDGTSGVLAHVDSSALLRVGKYGVDVAAFERIALPALREAMSGKQIVVMDEIGKMELASPRFCGLVREVLDSPSIVLATVMHPFADETKRRGDVEVLEVTICSCCRFVFSNSLRIIPQIFSGNALLFPSKVCPSTPGAPLLARLGMPLCNRSCNL